MAGNGLRVCEGAEFFKAKIILMNIDIDKLISELEARKKLHKDSCWLWDGGDTQYHYHKGKLDECDFFIQKLIALKNEQPEAITDDAHFCKHDVGQSAESDETSSNGVSGAASSETQAVGQNEQAKEVKQCSQCNGFGMYRYRGGMIECFLCGGVGTV